MFAMAGGDGVIRVFNVVNEVWFIFKYQQYYNLLAFLYNSANLLE